jgi:hypothetical protein
VLDAVHDAAAAVVADPLDAASRPRIRAGRGQRLDVRPRDRDEQQDGDDRDRPPDDLLAV